MPTITEGNLTFTFPASVQAEKYDAWSFYRNQFQARCSKDNKAVDIVAIAGNQTAWLIEIKDFRIGGRDRQKEKRLPLADEIAQKVRDSLAGLVAAKFNASDPTEKNFATQFVNCSEIKIILHIEQPNHTCKIIFNLSDLQDKLKILLKAIDSRIKTLNIAEMTKYPNQYPWEVK